MKQKEQEKPKLKIQSTVKPDLKYGFNDLFMQIHKELKKSY